MGKLKFFSIGSGSSGNCYYVGTGEWGILIDAGVAVGTVKKVLKRNGISMESIWGVFITHNHTDHIKSVGTLGEKYHIPVYATEKIHEGINKNYKVTEKLCTCVRKFKRGDVVQVKDFSISSFFVDHDAIECVGYCIQYNDKRFVIATDLGYINKEAADHIVKANYLVVEANYDDEMLKNGPYPYPLKERVRSATGHLSNEHTARFLADNDCENLTHVFLCHLSKENNTASLAFNTVNNALQEAGKSLEVLHPLERVHPSPMFIL